MYKDTLKVTQFALIFRNAKLDLAKRGVYVWDTEFIIQSLGIDKRKWLEDRLENPSDPLGYITASIASAAFGLHEEEEFQ